MQIDAKFSTPREGGMSQWAQLGKLTALGISIRVTVRSLPDGRPTGAYPETGFEEINSDVREPDFWPRNDFRLALHPCAIRSHQAHCAPGPPQVLV